MTGSLLLLSVPYGSLIVASALFAAVRVFRVMKRLLRVTVPVAILRTAADLLRMAAWSVPGAAWLRGWRERHRTQRGWNRQLRKLGGHDRDNFCGKGIPRRDWAKFLDELAVVLREMRSSEERES